MADLGFVFDSSEVEPSTGFDLMPPGEYQAVITRTERKPTKSGGNEMLVLEFEVIDTVCNGRKLWVNLNIWHSNPTAVDLSRKDLSAVCRAVGVKRMERTEELENKPLIIKVAIKPRKDNGENENRIVGYLPSATKAAPAATKKPWERG
jgi:hypothetical protein